MNPAQLTSQHPLEDRPGSSQPDRCASMLYQVAILAAAALLICSAALL